MPLKSTSRAHFYGIYFTKSDLSIVSTTFNAVEGSLIKRSRLSSLFRLHEIRAKAYLDVVNVSAVMISTPERLLKVIITCCIYRPKTKEEDYMYPCPGD